VMTIVPPPGLPIVPGSRVSADGAEWALAETTAGWQLVVTAGHPAPRWFGDLEGEAGEHGTGRLLVGPASARNAALVRAHLPWLQPIPLGLRTSIGMGDRLGVATPGHVRAVRAVGERVAPVFAQQSIREMTRTGRSPRQVIDDATWGAFREGWRGVAGADADHLKTTADIDACVSAGFSLFTIDPGALVDTTVEQASRRELWERFAALPWPVLEDRPGALMDRYANRTFDIEDHAIRFDEHTLLKAAAKYGGAVAHVSTLHRHLLATAGAGRFEIEVSVDETDTPTSHAEHVYVATELHRLGVTWVSLAPRYVGRFEKGVDYIGDVAAFEADCAVHAAIARCLGPYKLSLHSGSDKFSIYDAMARQAHGRVHLKTAGTSYLEALRTLAVFEPPLFREIYRVARDRYEEDRATYHVSADVNRTAPDAAFADGDLACLLDRFDAREVLHVTFGSVLSSRAPDGTWLFRDRLLSALRTHLGAYAANLEAHFVRHLRPFADGESR
jgi:hypothetical protein